MPSLIFPKKSNEIFRDHAEKNVYTRTRSDVQMHSCTHILVHTHLGTYNQRPFSLRALTEFEKHIERNGLKFEREKYRFYNEGRQAIVQLINCWNLIIASVDGFSHAVSSEYQSTKIKTFCQNLIMLTFSPIHCDFKPQSSLFSIAFYVQYYSLYCEACAAYVYVLWMYFWVQETAWLHYLPILL